MYNYKPLDTKIDSLRLLILLPPDGISRPEPLNIGDQEADNTSKSYDQAYKPPLKSGGLVHCKLEHWTFASKPSYEALSYTWGDGPATKTIKVDDQSFSVKPNLYNALAKLRQRQNRVLWIDAICIDQANILERNYQVSLMAFIYTRALRVLVFLNLKFDHTTTDWKRIGWQEIVRQTSGSKAIASNPYWKRLWIIQELILPAEVIFYVDDFQLTEQQMQSISVEAGLGSDFQERFDKIIHHRQKRHDLNFRLEVLIDTFKDANCTEPRDKIFGLLGLAHDAAMIDVDYEIGFYDLYTNLIAFHQSSEAIISYGPPGVDRALRLVPFSEVVQHSLGGAVDNDSKKRKHEEVYTARGAILGKILHVGPTYRESISSMHARKVWQKTLLDFFIDDRHLGDMRSVERQFYHDMVDGSEETLSKVQRLRGTSYGYKLSSSGNLPFTDEEPLTDFEPRYFCASGGTLGIAPAGTSVGDLVCVFLECKSTAILHSSGEDRWAIVGKAKTVSSPISNQESIALGRAMICDVAELQAKPQSDWSYRDKDKFEAIINLRLDLETLQKLTC